MPLAAIIIGALLIDLAFRGTEHQFAQQVGADFGQGSKFWTWAAAIGILGGLGYVESLKQISRLSLALVIVVLVLVNGGLFSQLASIVSNPPAAAPPVPISKYGSSNSSGGSGSGGQQGSQDNSGADVGSTIAEVAPILLALL